MRYRLTTDLPFQISWQGQPQELRIEPHYHRLVRTAVGAPETAPYTFICTSHDMEHLLEELTFLGVDPLHRAACSIFEQAVREQKAERVVDPVQGPRSAVSGRLYSGYHA